MSFAEIRRRHQDDFGALADTNLAKNLFLIVNDGYIERKPDEKRRVIYSLAKSYFHSKLREAIQEIVRKSNRVYEIGFEATAIGLDDEKDQSSLTTLRFPLDFSKKIEELMFWRLESEIHQCLFESSESNFVLVSEAFARIIWTGFLLDEWENRKVGLIHSEVDNARRVLEQEHDMTEEWNYGMYLKNVLLCLKLDARQLDEITDLQWLMLGHLSAQYAYAYKKLEDIQGTIEENLKLIENARNLIERIIEGIRNAKFMMIIPYGYKEIEMAAEAKLVDEFRKWRKALEMGYLDHREEIFDLGIKNVETFSRYLDSLPHGKRKPILFGRMRTKELPDLVIDPNQQVTSDKALKGLSTVYLYKNFPEARTPEFWTTLYESINKRCLERIKTPT